MFFETLENRSLFSVSLSAGVLTVTGTPAADVISIVKNASGGITVTDDGVVDNFSSVSVAHVAVNAGAGNDRVTLQNAVTQPAVIHGGDGNDFLSGGGGADQVYGDAGSDSLYGNNGDDSLIGGDGNDFLNGGDGADYMSGGAGTDTVDYSGRNEALSIWMSLDGGNVSGSSAHDIRWTGDHYTGDRIEGDIENCNGGSGNDVIYGNSLNNLINGNGGNDQLYGLAGNDSLNGGAGEDFLSGGDGNDQLHGGVGDDTMRGGAGADNIFGDAGFDFADYQDHTSGLTAVSLNGVADDGTFTLFTSEADNVQMDVEGIIGAVSGNNLLQGNDGPNELIGGSGNDTIYGNGGNDSIYGGAGADQLHGGAGDDSIYGDIGNDIMWGDDGNDTLRGGQGADVFWGGAGAFDEADFADRTENLNLTLDDAANDGAAGEGDNIHSDVEIIIGGFGNDILTGDAADNQLYGMAGNDTCEGMGGDDYLLGGDGNDYLHGGSGHDTLAGQAGNDIFYSLDGEPDILYGNSAQDSFFMDGFDTFIAST